MQTNPDELSIIYMSALLHDIGKVFLRAGSEKKNHSELGAQKLEELLPDFPGKKQVVEGVRYHHIKHLKDAGLEPQHPAYIICEADSIAAGADRRRIIEGEDEGFEPSVPLQSVFHLLGEESEDAGKGPKFRLKPFGLDDEIVYPRPSEELKASSDRYSQILLGSGSNGLIDNIRKYNTERDSVNSLLEILECFTSYIPSSTNKSEVPDISLFDHSKLTAAVASCMKIYLGETDYSRLLEESDGFRREKAFILLSGDISGIQDFIYTVSSRMAMKSLRGRSLYLELFLEHIADEILEQLGLKRPNLMYTGGGHFYMLLPNTSEARETIERASVTVNDWLLDRFGTSLYLALGYTEASANELMNEPYGSLGKVYGRASSMVSGKKLKRYTREQLKSLFVPQQPEGREECEACKSSKNIRAEDTEDSGTLLLCESCRSFAALGRDIAKNSDKTKYIIILKSQDAGKKIICRFPSVDGKEQRFMYIADEEEAISDAAGENTVRIYSINRKTVGKSLSTNLWCGNYNYRTDKNTLIDFKTLADKSTGIKKLAVLRADVDDLGAIFTSGFNREGFKYATLSRTSTLSRQLSMFFKYYINVLCCGRTETSEGYGEEPFSLKGSCEEVKQREISIVYSGGDDVFIVGAWDKVIEFAVDLYNAYKKFTGGKTHFSAGIAMFRPGFPVYQMANLTGELEAFAKSQEGKNSVALFGSEPSEDMDGAEEFRHVYKWDDFIQKVMGEKLRSLQKWFSPGGRGSVSREKLPIGNSFLYRMLQLLKEAEGDRINVARLAYTLARIEPSQSEKMSSYREAKKLIYQWILDESDRKQLITAIIILIYLNRERRDNNG